MLIIGTNNSKYTSLWFSNFVLPESADEAAGGERLLDEEGLGRSAPVQEASVVDVPLRMRRRGHTQEEEKEQRR